MADDRLLAKLDGSRRRRLQPHERGYTKRWRRAALRYLKRHPTCALFGKDTKCTGIAKCVDHLIPHRGDLRLFWDRRNWQGLCLRCHNRKSRSEQLGALGLKVDLSGMPTHWQ